MQLDQTQSPGFHAIDLGDFRLDGVAQIYLPHEDSAYVCRQIDRAAVPATVRAANPFGQRRSLRIVAGSSHPARIKVEVNDQYTLSGELLGTMADGTVVLNTFTPSTNTGADGFSRPATLSESAQEYRVRITFDSAVSNNEFYLLIAQSSAGVGSAVTVFADPAYSRAATASRAAVYVTALFCWGFWLLVKDSPGLADGLLPLVLALAYALFPKLVHGQWAQKLSLGELLKQTFAKLKGKGQRTVFAGVAGLLAVVSGAAFGIAFYTYQIKNSYVEEMRSVVMSRRSDYGDILSVMSQIPWRREVFLAYEIRSRQFKYTPSLRERWRKEVAIMVNSAEFRRAISSLTEERWNDRLMEWLLLKGDRSTMAYQDPALTIAYILPEAGGDEDFTYKKQAVDLLRMNRGSDCRATLLRLYIEYDIARLSDERPKGTPALWPRTVGDVIVDLDKEISRYISYCKGVPAVQEYVAAQDKLAFHSVFRAADDCRKENIEQAVARISEVLEMQTRRLALSERTVWRSPGKLGIYRFWRFINYEDEPGKDPMYGAYQQEFQHLKECPLLLSQLKDMFQKRNKDLGQEDSWTANTALQNSLHEFVVKELNLDWLF